MIINEQHITLLEKASNAPQRLLRCVVMDLLDLSWWNQRSAGHDWLLEACVLDLH